MTDLKDLLVTYYTSRVTTFTSEIFLVFFSERPPLSCKVYLFLILDPVLHRIILHIVESVVVTEFDAIPVRDTHGGGWSRNINARYLHTLMVYL